MDESPAHHTFQICEHVYCADCLKTLFTNATKDETLFPPRCCRQEFDIALVETYLSVEELNAFHEAAVEFTTENRVYCSRQRCGKFVPPSQYKYGDVIHLRGQHIYGDIARCGNCKMRTCIYCKQRSHSGECTEDPAFKETLALAQAEGWQRCNRCSSLVELTIGCYHMT